ncbi:hypothetical protein [Streptomyces sp. NPDC012888]|uniref:hypothetical protein n=1 Tax=Streptomyces sp. NPDC012888 TaxID=3364855 RepID=UPI0036C4D626
MSDTTPEPLYSVAEAADLLLGPQAFAARHGRLSPENRELLAALDDHALWMILHDDDCEDDECTGCVDNPPTTGGAR